jgi:type I restriction enzyme S subunit
LLGDLCRVKTGQKDVNEGNPKGVYPFFTCAENYTFSDSYSFDTEALLIAGNGNVGQVEYFKGKFEAYQRTYVLDEFRGVTARYLYHILKTQLSKAVSKKKLGTAMPYIKKGMLTDYQVYVPTTEEQKDACEQFDDLTTRIDTLARLYEQKVIVFEELKNSVMARYFSGQAEVTS